MIEDFAALLREAQPDATARPICLAIDEWNTWYRAKGPRHERGGWRTGAPLLQEGYNLEDALVAGQYLASFIRHADVVKLACLAQVVNALAPIITSPGGILKQTIYHAFALFARHARGSAVHAAVQGPLYQAGERGLTPAIDAAATFDVEAPCWAVFLTNRLVAEAVEVSLSWFGEAPASTGGGTREGWQLSGDDPKAVNTFTDPERVAPVEIDPPVSAGGSGKIILPAMSLTVLRF